MKILVINAGSSSLKYQLIDMETEVAIAKGGCERIGLEGSFLKHTKLKRLLFYDWNFILFSIAESLRDHKVGTIVAVQLLVWLLFHENAVHADGGAESFDVVDGVTDGFLVGPELREELIGFSFVEVRANDHRVRLVGSKELITLVFGERFEVKLRSLRLFLPQA